jgi:hypothetical protein
MSETLSVATKDREVLTALVAVLARAWEAGSPVAGQSVEQRREMAAVALRRMRSFARRGVPINDRPSCVRDLAKGLASRFEIEPRLVGPPIRDYEFVATALLDAYADEVR